MSVLQWSESAALASELCSGLKCMSVNCLSWMYFMMMKSILLTAKLRLLILWSLLYWCALVERRSRGTCRSEKISSIGMILSTGMPVVCMKGILKFPVLKLILSLEGMMCVLILTEMCESILRLGIQIRKIRRAFLILKLL